MLPEQHRLPSKEIAFVARKGQRLGNSLLDIRRVQQPNSTEVKVAITVPIRVSKKAVVRNRIRRRLKAGVMSLIKSSQLAPGKYLILGTSSDLEAAKDIHETLLKALTSKR